MAVVFTIGDAFTFSGGGFADMPVAGSDTQIQFNDGGVFGASAAFTFNKTTNTVVLGAVGTAGVLKGADNAAGTGVGITLQGGGGGATNAGGTVTISGGSGGATSGAGGAVTVRGGTSTDGNSGAANLQS